MKFGYEDLEAWNKALDSAVQVIETVDKISTNRKHYRLLEQIESSSTSVSMNSLVMIWIPLYFELSALSSIICACGEDKRERS